MVLSPTRQTHEVGHGKDYDRFHASLTLYLAEIAGIASHGKQLKKISSERKLEFQRIAAQSFFERHPDFGYIEQRIESSDVPDLKRRLKSTEEARLLIVEALAQE